MNYPKPTPEDCSANAKIFEDIGEVGYAAWYPQMGGYVGISLILVPRVDEEYRHANTCFEALVWHNGEFPFSDGNPRRIHHCDANQFIRFGEEVLQMISKAQ